MKNPDGSRIDVVCSPLLPDYQKYMRGVDRGDQLVGYYNEQKMVEKVFSHLIECSLLNVYVLDSLILHKNLKGISFPSILMYPKD